MKDELQGPLILGIRTVWMTTTAVVVRSSRRSGQDRIAHDNVGEAP